MRETRVRACGKEWVIPAEPTVDCILRLRDWIAEQEGDPFAGIKEMIALGLPAEDARAAIQEARATKKQLQCFSLKCELAQAYLHTEVGGFKFVELILRDAYPAMSDPEVQAVTRAYAEKLAAAMPVKKEPEGNGQAPEPMADSPAAIGA